MRPADVNPEWVEKAARALRDEQCTGRDHGTDACPDRHCRDDSVLPWYRDRMREPLAAVLPLARMEAKVEAVSEARKVISQYLVTAEKWRYDRVMWAFAVMLGEVPEDTPCPDSPADARERAARLREGSPS